ncbi:MAG: TIGR04086 family membrane protein [Bacillota bacterium]|nr:TIGR04086 family membrane protein [Bacillota bacterium]
MAFIWEARGGFALGGQETRWGAILWGGVAGLLGAALLALAWALLIRWGGLAEGPSLKAAHYSGYFLALWAGGVAARRAGARGWFHGALGGLFYGLAAAALSLLMFSTAVSLGPFLADMGLALFLGVLGGILALNL